MTVDIQCVDLTKALIKVKKNRPEEEQQCSAVFRKHTSAMRGVGGAAAVGTATPPKRSTLPFNPVKGSDGTWTLKPTEEEKVLDEERARVSKLPRYVVAGNNVHGEPRYGVKIKIPGQRGQVRALQPPRAQRHCALRPRAPSLPRPPRCCTPLPPTPAETHFAHLYPRAAIARNHALHFDHPIYRRR